MKGFNKSVYPIVSLVNDRTGAIHFERSFDFDQMAPRRSTLGVCSFTLLNTNNGNYHVHVSASGLEAANAVPITIGSDRGWDELAAIL